MNNLSKKGTPHKSKQERRTQILLVAQKCFTDKGYNKTTMREIVKETGLSQGAIYHYFEGKEDIAIAIIMRLDESISEMMEVVKKENYSLESLNRCLFNNLDLYFQIYRFTATLPERKHSEKLQAVISDVVNTAHTAIKVCVAHNLSDQSDLSIEEASVAVLAMIEGICSLANDSGKLPLENNYRNIWKVIESLLKQ